MDTILTQVKTGYEYLVEMIRVKNAYSSFTPVTSPLTNRGSFIVDALNKLGIGYQVHPFDHNGIDLLNFNGPKLINIIVEFKGVNDELPAVMFMAHHDINNPASENCQDNSASVCNLLELCGRLATNTPTRPTWVVFTDKEEFGGIGAKNLSIKVNEGRFPNLQWVINLELTGLGTSMWIDSASRPISPLGERFIEIFGADNIHRVNTPFNDAMVLRGFGIDALCVGILPAEEITGRKMTWSLCHRLDDTIDKISSEDMTAFVDKLLLFSN